MDRKARKEKRQMTSAGIDDMIEISRMRNIVRCKKHKFVHTHNRTFFGCETVIYCVNCGHTIIR